jgi:hypothetical protein
MINHHIPGIVVDSAICHQHNGGKLRCVSSMQQAWREKKAPDESGAFGRLPARGGRT